MVSCMLNVLVFETRYYGRGGVAGGVMQRLIIQSPYSAGEPSLPTHGDPYAVFETRYYGRGGVASTVARHSDGIIRGL